MEKKWNLKYETIDQEELAGLQQALGISKTLCEILIQRGIKTYNEAHKFFRPNVSQLHDPFLLKDMQKSIEIILEAIQFQKKILLYGDYDVDGTTSVSCMILFFKKFYPTTTVLYFIPNRLKDGYGITQAGYDFAINNNIDLIITLDCGIKSNLWIERFNTQNIQTIICDHHIPDEKNFPPAIAVINPLQSDCDYPFKNLCACGLTFKLISAFIEHQQLDKKFLNEIIELCALATSADIVPLIDENRILVVTGLKKINQKPIVCIQALQQITQPKTPITNHQLVFNFAPRINAAGRMDTPKIAVDLLIEPHLEVALLTAQKLNKYNLERKEIDALITNEAIDILHHINSFDEQFSIVVFDKNWHKGVLGIIASRLVEKYYKPAIVFTKANNFLVGSARSIEGFSLIAALDNCAEFLDGYGGHFYAAGLQLQEKNLLRFKIAFEEEVKKKFALRPIPTIDINSLIEFKTITENFNSILYQFEPYGPQNLRPHFLSKNICIKNVVIIKEAHLKFELYQDNTKQIGIFFNAKDKLDTLKPDFFFDVVYTIEGSVYKGIKEISLNILDLKQTNKI